MSATLPDGVRASFPPAAAARQRWRDALRALYASWGYQPVDLPSLERYDPSHPRAEQAFKLSDRDGGLLALRSDLTPSLARVVQRAWPDVIDPEVPARPIRVQVEGAVWQAIDPEVTRTREFTQIGVELVGMCSPRADAELIHLARESVRLVGLTPRVEVGNPGFVRALMDEADVPGELRSPLADAIDRKDLGEVEQVLQRAGVRGAHAAALRATPDLYGGTDVLAEATELATGPASRAALAHLQGVLGEFDDDRELLLDLGMARRLAYYTGLTFRAYTVDFAQPLLGGGRYDGALLPYAAGFSVGLERLESALATQLRSAPPARVVALDDAGARRLRQHGIAVIRSIATEPDGARDEAHRLAVPWVLLGDVLERTPGVPVSDEEAEIETEQAELERRALHAILEGRDA